MELNHGFHLAYCTNIHRGETWPETMAALQQHTLRVREQLEVSRPFAIGLRLGVIAARELAEPLALDAFRRWLDTNDCYVFTINGFPYGDFHGTRVKEQVYRPDWADPKRLTYTNQLFDILSAILPQGMSGSVSTVPGSFKEFVQTSAQKERIYANLTACCRHIDSLCHRTGQDLHLGLEPEPLGWIETTTETVAFFDNLHAMASVADQPVLHQRLGVNYDTCHLAVEFESAPEALTRLVDAGIRLSKIHLSSALRFCPVPAALKALGEFADDTYLHQVIVAKDSVVQARYRDIEEALSLGKDGTADRGDEWRVHFHVPLHAAPEPPLADTREDLKATLDWLAANPARCSHLEMETYTWEVLPETAKSLDVVSQLVKEYQWTLAQLRKRGMAN